MSATGIPATGRAAAENELLAQLGLPPSAGPDEIDNLHQAASEYLSAAPTGIRGWAHAQATALDAAYLQLTDPVGFGGSALRSPTRPPTVDPGEPATPPARREPVPAAPPASIADTTADALEIDDDDVDALYASVTPSAHRDTRPDDKPRTRNGRPQRASLATTRERSDGGTWKRLALGGVAVATAIGVLLVGYSLGGSGTANGAAADAGGALASDAAPAIDQAKVSDLMTKVAADPTDTTSMMDLANEFYAGEKFSEAGTWLDKLLVIDPKNVEALLARGAVSFNLGDLTAAETTWQRVVAIEPANVEVHYDLGFLYLNQSPADMAGVQREWTKVVQLGPGTQLATTVQSHLDSLAASSMIPAGPSAASAAPAGSAAASPGASPVPSPASPVPSAAASPRP